MKARITTSYGRIATANGQPIGILYGAGYGKDATLTTYATRAAKILSRLGRPIEKRGNTDGESVGAFIDNSNGHCLGLSAKKYNDGKIKFHALLWTPIEKADEALAEIPNVYGYGLTKEEREYHKNSGRPLRTASIYSPPFDTLRAAAHWLSRWAKFCPDALPA